MSKAIEAGDAAALPQMVEVSRRDALRMRRAIAEKYGFLPTLAYCRDLIAYTDQMSERAHIPQKEDIRETT